MDESISEGVSELVGEISAFLYIYIYIRDKLTGPNSFPPSSSLSAPVTFTPAKCLDEEWTCQVQGTWSNCICNERGTPAVPLMHNSAFMNVNSCQFFRVSGYYLLLDASFVIIGLVQSSAMFKMSQYSPDAERVNLGGVACFFLPSSLQQSCNARPEESKGE